MNFKTVIEKYRKHSFSEKDKGERFERLMKAYLLTDPKYTAKLKKVWLWSDFPGRNDLGGWDVGIDLVALTIEGDYWAIQCKCYAENATIDKPSVDGFLSTSSRKFKGEDLLTTGFAHRLWISTTNNWGPNAIEAIQNQHPPVSRISLTDLLNAPVNWEKLEANISGEGARTDRKKLRRHQHVALNNTHEHFNTNNRGKLIMACGTGKTFNSLRIAEHETGGKGFILFLVPSIALLGQTLNEWSADALKPLNAICICSDAGVTKKRKQLEDIDTTSVVDLAYPASTNVRDILHQFAALDRKRNEGLTVVFSTYQSIEVIANAQKSLQKTQAEFGEFDLIICDEAHRTTGISLAGEDESAFTKVHSNDFIRAKKRLYMTATPRLYDDNSKSRAAQAEALLCSMDDATLYGEEMYRIGFGEAVAKDLLTDYKVLILTLNENDVPPAVQKMIADSGNEINTDDASKLIGCMNALSKQILGDEGVLKASDPEPMRRAVAFCQSIAASQKITDTFNNAAGSYLNSLPEEKREEMQMVSSRHVDGTMDATKRNELLSWLKDESDAHDCRILTNVRCLSEGVDVPSLDAVLFLSARNSQVDVVQSVGRVMRKSDATNKKYGYIIIPVLVPSNVEADKALDDNERYKVVWTVLNALRAHDDRFNATVNKIELNRKKPDNIIVGGAEYGFDGDGNPVKKDSNTDGSDSNPAAEVARQLALQFEQLQGVVFARLVNKVGDRRYWEQWAKSVAEIAQRHTARITKLISQDARHQAEFDTFLLGLHKNINPSITQPEAIEMLSQHIITRPVFEALFEGYSFVKNNAMSQSMQTMLDLLEEQSLNKDTETLQRFYDSVKTRASGIDNAEGKQRIIIELYDKFFRTAFPMMVEKLGIVYTPVEVVDFIIQSVADVLELEFGRRISDENIHILDPFTGTGTFISRLLQSGRIAPEDLERKYLHEIHANEIVLLAYYIAAVNIENTYHDLTPDPDDGLGKDKYTPFDGICLTDTFQLGETADGERLFSEMFPQNSKRVQRQKGAPLRIIIGNPPYSVGQKSANDNAQNQKYGRLDARIAGTYAADTAATNKNSLYDSYIKAFRWSSDRLNENNKHGGIICFVSNGAWLDGNSADGFRKSIEAEFSAIYVFNLRGNARTSGELRQKEAGNVFGSGSRTPIAITLLVKNPAKVTGKATIHYCDIGDYLDRDEKLRLIRGFKSFTNPAMPLQSLQINEHGDWIRVRNDAFGTFIPLADRGNNNTFWVNGLYCRGLETARDAWAYNSDLKKLVSRVQNTFDFYNGQLSAFNAKKLTNPKLEASDFVVFDASKISWSRAFITDIESNKSKTFDYQKITTAIYRPYFKQKLYFSRELNNVVSRMDTFFPSPAKKNLLICVSGVGVTKEFTTIITDIIPDLEVIGKSQCFPLYYYEKVNATQKGLFDAHTEHQYIRRDGISDFILNRAQKHLGKNVSKEDVFYYVYGFLHSPEYRQTFAADLKKMLPRLPLVDTVKDFWAFSKAGRSLAALHLNYESIPPHPDVTVSFKAASLSQAFMQAAEEEVSYNNYRVQKMRFPAKDRKDTIIYNSQITLENIPAKAYEYVVNGKSAIEWIMERYQVTTHKESGIKNDPNDWAQEQGKPRYILDLLLSIINVSCQTVDIVAKLPKVNFAQEQTL